MGTSTFYYLQTYCAVLLLFVVSPEKVFFHLEAMKGPSRDMAATGMEGGTERKRRRVRTVGTKP